MKAVCPICPHACALEEGQGGLCRARVNRGGRVVPINFGRLTGLALDPIEKKPLRRFFPGSRILSAGSFGCNLRCPFCQNCEISMAGPEIPTALVPPGELAAKAEALRGEGNLGVAYTYNEPLVGYEYVRACAEEVRRRGMKNVLVTNGFACEAPFLELLPWIDAVNIDLKGFTQGFYQWVGGVLEVVQRSIQLAAGRCHLEVTTLIIPGENNTEEEMRALSAWLAGVSPEIPLHITRFYPRHKLLDRPPTPAALTARLAQVARENLRHVYC